MSLKEFKLPSGAVLKYNLAPFTDSRDLYQSILKEAQNIGFNFNDDIDINFIKNIICVLLSSKDIERAIWKCFEKALYNGNRITSETFEEEEARQDYFDCMTQIAWANILPFMKGLFAKYEPIINQLKEALTLK